MITRSVPRFLWPDDHQRTGLPFRDGEVEEEARKTNERYLKMPLQEALVQIRKDREQGLIP